MTENYDKYGDAAERMLNFVETRTTDQAADVFRVPVTNYSTRRAGNARRSASSSGCR